MTNIYNIIDNNDMFYIAWAVCLIIAYAVVYLVSRAILSKK